MALKAVRFGETLMALVVITIQDEEDGQVSLGFTSEPVLTDNPEDVTSAQTLGIMGVSFLMQSISGDSALD